MLLYTRLFASAYLVSASTSSAVVGWCLLVPLFLILAQVVNGEILFMLVLLAAQHPFTH